MRSFFNKIIKKKDFKKGVSMIALVITVIVIIILAAIAMRSSINSTKEASFAEYRSELKAVEVDLASARLKNQIDGMGEDVKENGFYKVYIENPPSDFVSFGTDEYYGYVVDLEKINQNATTKKGKDFLKYSESEKNLVFGKRGEDNDVYVYDAIGKVYYAKGYYAEEGVYYSDTVTLDGPRIAITKSLIKDAEDVVTAVKLLINITPELNDGSLEVRVNNNLQTPNEENTYEYVAYANGSIKVSAEESERRISIKNVNITEFAEVDYLITYHLKDEEDTVETQTKHGDATIRLKSYRREGFTLEGWSNFADSSSVDYAPGALFEENGNRDLYAVWTAGEPRQYQISFNANGGRNAPEPITKLQSEVITLPLNTPEKSGYAFMGWSKSSKSASVEYHPGDSFSEDADTVLYAIWGNTNTMLELHVEPEGAGTTVGAGIQPAGELVYISAIPTEGYTFDRWALDEGSVKAELANYYTSTTRFTMPNGIVSLTAYFSVADYTIKYDANGGAGAPEAQYKKHGESITLSDATPTKSGKTFKGWSTSITATTVQYLPGATYSEDASVVLYAVWESNTTECTLTFDANGGTNAPKAIKKVEGSIINIPAQVPQRSNLIFLGWNEDKTAKQAKYHKNDEYTLTQDVTFYAIWSDKEKPKVRITADEEEGELVLFGSATDNGGIIEYAWTNEVYSPVSYSSILWESLNGERLDISIKYNVSKAGMHYFYVKDIDGNVAYASIEVFKMDFISQGEIIHTKYKASGYSASLISTTPKRERYVFDRWQAESDGRIYNSGELYTLNKHESFQANWNMAVAWIPAQNEYFLSANDAAKTVLAEGSSFEYIELLLEDNVPLELQPGQKISLGTENIEAGFMTVEMTAITIPTGASFKLIDGRITGGNYGIRNAGTAEILKGSISGPNAIYNSGSMVFGDGSKAYQKDYVVAEGSEKSYVGSGTLSFQNGSLVDNRYGSSIYVVPLLKFTPREGFVIRTIGTMSSSKITTTITEEITITSSITVGTNAKPVERRATITSNITSRDSSSTIEYKIDEGNWTLGSQIDEIIDNCTVYARTSDQDGVAAQKSLAITDIVDLKLSFDANGGNVNKQSQMIKYKRPYNVNGNLPTPTRNYYVFNGWYTAKDGGSKIENSTIVMVTDDQKVYAHWSGEEYQVDLNPKGGSTPSPSRITVRYQEKYGTLPTTSRSGYEFLGWYTTETTGGKKIESDTIVETHQAHTLYARWQQLKYTITFDANGGYGLSFSSKEVNVGDAYGSFPSVYRSGYTKDGWKDSSGNWKYTSDKPNSSHTLYAQWSEIVEYSCGCGGCYNTITSGTYCSTCSSAGWCSICGYCKYHCGGHSTPTPDPTPSGGGSSGGHTPCPNPKCVNGTCTDSPHPISGRTETITPHSTCGIGTYTHQYWICDSCGCPGESKHCSYWLTSEGRFCVQWNTDKHVEGCYICKGKGYID